jgi:glycosyltransferase involved in cell wall biosynthesis
MKKKKITKRFKMYIIYDARHIKNKYSGLGRLTFTILFELIKFNRFDKLEIILDKNIDYSSNEIIKSLSNHISNKIKYVYINAPLFNLIKNFNITKYVNKNKPDIYFYPHFDLPIGIKCNSIFMVHDVFSKKNFYHEYDTEIIKDFIYGLKKKRVLKNFIFKNIIKFNLKYKNINCVTISNATKSDLLEFIDHQFINKIRVVYLDFFRDLFLSNEALIENQEENIITKRKYLLYVGDRRPHKNLKKMIDIFNELSKENNDLYFYIVGNMEKIFFDYSKYIKALDNYKIIQINNVSDTFLEKLYLKCNAFFFLSKHEGFGLPLLEAARFNKKIITSNKSSLIEIAPNNSLFIDPEINIQEGRIKIFNYLKEDIIIDNTDYLSKFSWKRTMKEIFYSE